MWIEVRRDRLKWLPAQALTGFSPGTSCRQVESCCSEDKYDHPAGSPISRAPVHISIAWELSERQVLKSHLGLAQLERLVGSPETWVTPSPTSEDPCPTPEDFVRLP